MSKKRNEDLEMHLNSNLDVVVKKTFQFNYTVTACTNKIAFNFCNF